MLITSFELTERMQCRGKDIAFAFAVLNLLANLPSPIAFKPVARDSNKLSKESWGCSFNGIATKAACKLEDTVVSGTKQIGIWFVAAYFFGKGAFIAVKAGIAFYSTSEAPGALVAIREMVPLVRWLDLGPDLSLITASAFVLFEIVVGVCVLRRQKWTAGYIVAIHGIALLWFLVASLGLSWLGFEAPSPALTSPYFKFEVSASLLMVAYLVDPDVMRSFGFS